MADSPLDTALISLERVQKFDTSKLPREAQLGEDLNLLEAVEPAERIINLFRQFPIEFLRDLPPTQLHVITATADSFFQLLTQATQFNGKQADAFNARSALIQSLKSQYQNYFDQLQQLISYGSSRQRDFASMERDFRAAMQRADDNASEVTKKLASQQEEGQKVLEEIRRVAAEQGVSQQARYFQEESVDHLNEAKSWRNWTIGTAIALGFYAIISIFMHKWGFLAPADTYQAVQLALSKVLIFAVLGYMLLLCVRNFLSHQHNAIVNKHRQNALLTFNALVNAAGTEERRDVILTYAAACIFSPQDTGYTKGNAAAPEMPLNIIQAIPKLASGTHT